MREIAADLRRPAARRRLRRRRGAHAARARRGPATGSPPTGRRKLAAAGIAPPAPAAAAQRPVPLTLTRAAPPSPARAAARADTVETAAFSATACKALHRCRHVRANRSSTSRRSDRAVERTDVPPADGGRAVEPAAPTTPPRSPSPCRAELRRAFAFRARPVADASRRGGRAALVLDLRAGRRTRRASACARSPAARCPAGWCARSGPATWSRCRPRPARSPPTSTPRRHHVLIAAGSGITPDAVDRRVGARRRRATPRSTLLYGNRRTDSVMFADELADLKDAYPAAHAAGARAVPRAAGGRAVQRPARRATGCATCCRSTVDVAAVDHWWLCGPFGMVTDAIDVLAELGVPRERIHRELFYVEDEPPAEVHAREAAGRPAAPRSPSCSTAGDHRDRAAGHAGARRRPAGAPRPAVRLQGRRVRHLPGAGRPTARCRCGATSPSSTTRSRPASC